jgi:hypothetical protein
VGDMTPIALRQDVLVPVRMKNGVERVCEIGLVEMVANSVYHP